MRDDLHKGIKLPPWWKKAVGFCLRKADQGTRAISAVTEAIEIDIQQQVTQDGLNSIIRECEAPRLPFENNEHCQITTHYSETERRIRLLSLNRVEAEHMTPHEAVSSSLSDVIRECRISRMSQAETQLIQKAPRHSKEIIRRLRSNSSVDISEITTHLLNGNRPGSVNNAHRMLDPDEDLQ